MKNARVKFVRLFLITASSFLLAYGFGAEGAGTEETAADSTARAASPFERIDARAVIREQLVFRCQSGPQGDGRDVVPVQILAINDFHGQVSAGKIVSKRPAGGAPVLFAYLKDASRRAQGGTIFVSAGDLVGASMPESALLQDEPAVMLFTMLGNRFSGAARRLHPHNNLVAIPGNHEFDEGKGELLRLAYGGNHPSGPFLQDPYEGAGFPFVCANVVDKETGLPLFPPLAIKNLDGVGIAFVGAVLRDTPTMVTPSSAEGLEFLDEAEAVNFYVRILAEHGVRAVVAVIHQGSTQGPYGGPTDAGRPPASGPLVDIARHLDDEVDLVIGAHAHGFTNALVKTRGGKRVLATQAWSAGTAYADIDLEIDRHTRDVVSGRAEIVTAWADEGVGLTPDPAAAALVGAAEEKVLPLTSRVIGVAAGDIPRAQNAAGESALGNLVADAQRAAMGTDFAFMNPGGVRADLSAGEVTWGELFAVQPFNNRLVKMELTGAQVFDLLALQWAGQPYPRVLQVSGLAYTWDDRLPPEKRVVAAYRDGAPIEPGETYTATVNSFLAEGGDNFSVLREGRNRVVGKVDLEALVDHIAGLRQPFGARVEGRIVKVK